MIVIVIVIIIIDFRKVVIDIEILQIKLFSWLEHFGDDVYFAEE